jgi:hypothetical protein
MHKTANNMVTAPERVVLNAVRERKLAYVRGQGLVEREGALRKRYSTNELIRLELTRLARLGPELATMRQELISVPVPCYDDVGPDVRKPRKYKGKPIARTIRW